MSTGMIAHLAGSHIAVIFGLIGALGASSVIFIVPSFMLLYHTGNSRSATQLFLCLVLLGAVKAWPYFPIRVFIWYWW